MSIKRKRLRNVKGYFRMTDDRGQRAGVRGQRAEDRGQRTDDRGQGSEDRGQTTDDRGRSKGRGRAGRMAQSERSRL